MGGIGGLVLALVAAYFGIDPGAISGGPTTAVETNQPRSPEEDRMAEFSSVVLADTEDVWNKLFAQMGSQYKEPQLVLFSGAVESACGYATAAVGPFYCPPDQKAYLDLSFFNELHKKFGAPGDFAQAYVIAHEIGHHVQNLMGTSSKVRAAQQRMSKADANELSVRVELQADCYSGVWAHHADKSRDVLEQGDVEEALGAATAIGDDTLQRRSGGRVMPESFTHGTSAQRVKWFRTGLQSGDVKQCDTFTTSSL